MTPSTLRVSVQECAGPQGQQPCTAESYAWIIVQNSIRASCLNIDPVLLTYCVLKSERSEHTQPHGEVPNVLLLKKYKSWSFIVVKQLKYS